MQRRKEKIKSSTRSHQDTKGQSVEVIPMSPEKGMRQNIQREGRKDAKAQRKDKFIQSH